MTTVLYGQLPSQFAEVWTPQGVPKPGAVVLLHGGWWRARHDLRLMDGLAADLVDRGYLVWNIEYRRTEGGETDASGWPGTFDDVRAAVDTLCEGSPGVEPRSVVAIGHSAGGQLALLAARSAGLAGVVALAPITDLVACAHLGLGEGATSLFMGGDPAGREASYGEASPVELVPIGCRQLVVHGTMDGRVPVEHSRSYIERCYRTGDEAELREVRGGDHMFVLDPLHAYWAGTLRWVSDVLPDAAPTTG